MAKDKLAEGNFKQEAYAPKQRPGPSFKGAGKAPPSDAANTANPGGSMNVLKMWSKDGHKTGIRK